MEITDIYAFVALEGPGEEGIMAALAPGTGMMMPLIGADLDRLISLKPVADMVSRVTGVPYECRRFKLVGPMPLEG